MPDNDEVVEFGPFRLHVAGRLLQRNGVTVKLGSRSLDLLIALVERAGDVLSRRELIARAWSGLVVDEANLRVNIASLRKCLGESVNGARYIVNLPGRGYSFVAPVTRTRIESSAQKLEAIQARDPPGELGASLGEHSLPRRLGRVIGRDASVCALRELLAQHRFVSIIGPGGMGKTTVAISVAHAMLTAFDGAVYYIDLTSLTDASVIPSTIASVLGVKVQVRDPNPSILAFLSARRALLVLDNCEHLIDATAVLAEWLYQCAPQTHLLATSRELLRAEGEHVHFLPPLDVPPVDDGLTASAALAFPAVQLFMDRVAASGVQEELTDETALLAVEICRKMDGIALAIELAAGRVRSHGLRGTAELINSRFDLLWQGRRTAPPRHQTLQAMLDWSYKLLSECERCVLYRLSVFAAPFPLVAAQWIAADANISEAEVAAAVASLIDKSLLSPSTSKGAGQLRLLDSTRTYASAKLAESGEFDAVSRKLADYFIALLGPSSEPKSEWQTTKPDVMAVASVPTAQDGSPSEAGDAEWVCNLRTALVWAFSKAGEVELGVRLAALAAPRFMERFLLDECFRWCQAGLLRLGAEEGTVTHLVLQEALAVSALLTRGSGDAVRGAIERALRLARTLNDAARELGLLSALHIFMIEVGDSRGAIGLSWRSLELARRVGSPAGIVMSEWMLGCSYHLAGDQAGALRHIEEGFNQAAALGVAKVDRYGYGHRTRALIVLARALWLSGAVDRAASVAQQAIEEAERNEQPVNVLVAELLFAATVYLWRGDVEQAEALACRLTQYAGRYASGPHVAWGNALSGEVALLRGEFQTAVSRFREALGPLQGEGRLLLMTMLSRSMSEALLECAEIQEAEAMISAALERAEVGHDSYVMPELLRTRAQIGIASGCLALPAAEAMLWRSMELANSQCALSLELRSAMALGMALASEKRTEEAHAILAAVYCRFTEGHETLDLRTALRLIDSWRPTAPLGGAN